MIRKYEKMYKMKYKTYHYLMIIIIRIMNKIIMISMMNIRTKLTSQFLANDMKIVDTFCFYQLILSVSQNLMMVTNIFFDNQQDHRCDRRRWTFFFFWHSDRNWDNGNSSMVLIGQIRRHKMIVMKFNKRWRNERYFFSCVCVCLSGQLE